MKIQYLQYGNRYSNRYNRKKEKKTNKKFKILIYILLGIIVVCGIAFGALSLKYGVKATINKGFEVLNNITSPITNKITLVINEITGKNSIYYGLVGENKKTYYFVNNTIREDITNITALSPNNDVKAIIENETIDRLVNYPKGYYINLPKNLNYDFSLSKDFVKAYNNNIDITISMERSPYADVWEYIDYYQNRFFLDENYQQRNNITLHENKTFKINGYQTQVISLTRNTNSDVIKLNTYTYIYMKLSGQNYLRIMIKSNDFSEEYITTYTNILSSFTQIQPQFTDDYHIEYYPIPDARWNNKTKELYEKYTLSNDIDWGIFTADIANTGINETIPSMEKQLEYKFDVILMYNHLGNPLPLDAMKKISSQGRVIELTVQTCYANNTQLFDYTPMFDIIEGKWDDKIKTLAQEIKSLDTAILFRLNNEMNTDWTSYCGMTNLCDPNIYIQVWHKIYDIFRQENVSNCIWIYNPNDNNYPPSNWNNFLAYYPGNEYVHLLGITGYNPGTYYAEKNGETWKEFEYIYDEIYNKYSNIFSGFPWIITEFASSSVGGDKPQWINNMFKNIKKYRNIKIAVWFSAADYDENNNPARLYWLDETQQTLDAFKQGIKEYKQ